MDKIEINEKTQNLLSITNQTIINFQNKFYAIIQTYADAKDINLNEYQIADDFSAFIKSKKKDETK